MDAQERFDAEKFNALMKLADFRYQRWRERRTTDWKLSLALWTLLVATAAYFIAHKIEFRSGAVALVLIILVIGHAWLWVRNNWISNEMDIRSAFHFAEHAEKLVLPSNPGPKPRLDPEEFRKCNGRFKFLAAGFCQAQVCATSFLRSLFF